MARSLIACILLLATAGVLAQSCPNQGIGPGAYRIQSVWNNDGRCVITDPDKDSATFDLCSDMTGQATALATFTFMPDPSSGGCYTLGTVINGVYRYLLPTISPDLPGDALLVVAQPGHNSSMYWQVQNNSDGTYSFVAVGIPSRPCMNRRSDDDAGRVQAISCTTGDPNLSRFYLPSATSTPATLVGKSLLREAAFTDEPLTLTGQTTLTSDSNGQFAPVNVSYNAEFGNIPQVLIECIAGGCDSAILCTCRISPIQALRLRLMVMPSAHRLA